MLSALVFSLLSGSSSGLGSDAIDDLARSVRAPSGLADAMDTRIAHLETRADPLLAAESLDLVVPLADRLGLHTQRARLEDASFSALQPLAYSSLTAQLPSLETDSQTLAAVTRTLEDLLAQEDGALVSSRVKSVYGLHAKMQRKNLPLSAIADRLAVRAIVEDTSTCYAVLESLHATFTPVEHEFDDYIESPKSSGYQSLHTAVVVPGSDTVVEVQIRTHAMHDAAENGPAAHWRYKMAAAV